ncbi:hypothetical protein LAV75_23195, partial [Shigella flexneri]|nr:hypothetical protein [Shigella flexneri]
WKPSAHSPEANMDWQKCSGIKRSYLARAVSPITAVVVVTSGIAGVSPFAVVKRTAIPMAVGFVVNMIATITLFY